MLLPLRDDNPTHITPYVTYALIAACVLVFVWQLSLPDRDEGRMFLALGAVPAVVFQLRNLAPELAVFPAGLDFLSVVTAQFLHGGVAHLLGNMLYLWIFGNNVEDAMGHVRFAAFYLLCGVLSLLINGAVEPSSVIPTIGASGAISGVLGAYAMLYPHAKVLIWAVVFPLRVPAWLVLGFYIVMQIVNIGGVGDDSVAWWAHIGGFGAGMVLILVFKNRHVGLFGTGHLDQTAPPGEEPR